MAGTGMLMGVGTGPGDPELMTLKAVRALREADVIAYFAKLGNHSNARRVAASHIPPDKTELPLDYPVTTELPKAGIAYRKAIACFYDRSAAAIADHLDAGRSVAILSEGDPLFYGSYMHIHVRLASRYPARIVPGITAMSGCWSRAATPIAQGDDILTVLPGTLAQDQLARRLSGSDAAIIMKVGRNLSKIRVALQIAGRLDTALYVERGTMDEEIILRLADKADESAPYFSLILVPGWKERP